MESSEKKIRIAIDGPAGAGKSTVAKRLAKELGIDYVDTGAMYRAIALKLLSAGIDIEDAVALGEILENTDVDIDESEIILDGKNVSELIRTPEVSKMASDCSAVLAVRKKLVALQREIGANKSLVMDGRDIGTNVITDAEHKFFLTATAHERAMRRYREFIAKGVECDFESVKAEIEARDKQDSERKHNPLKQANDAVRVDSTDMSIDEVVGHMLKKIRGSN